MGPANKDPGERQVGAREGVFATLAAMSSTHTSDKACYSNKNNKPCPRGACSSGTLSRHTKKTVSGTRTLDGHGARHLGGRRPLDHHRRARGADLGDGGEDGDDDEADEDDPPEPRERHHGGEDAAGFELVAERQARPDALQIGEEDIGRRWFFWEGTANAAQDTVQR